MSPSFLSSKPQVIPWEHGSTQAHFIAVCRTVQLPRGHSDSIFPGCYIILFPVSENKEAVSLGTLLCGVGSGAQSLRRLGSLHPSFLETTDSPRVSLSPQPLLRSLPPCKVHTCARCLRPLQTPRGGVSHSVSRRERTASELHPQPQCSLPVERDCLTRAQLRKRGGREPSARPPAPTHSAKLS